MGNSPEIIHFETWVWSWSWTWKAMWTRGPKSIFRKTLVSYTKFEHANIEAI